MATYRFVTTWRLDAPIEAVWDVLHRTGDWPTWWPYVIRVDELEPGDATGLGARQRLTWRTRLPYTLAFEARVTRIEPPTLLEAEVQGELEGFGLWTLSEEGSVTAVRYEWNVRTTKPWMNWLAPLARPVFAWNHVSVMERGGQALARRLGVGFLGMER